jgi:glutathione synthase
MRQLLLIDPISKLNIKKDSSLMLAIAMQKRGIETYVFFENDFAIHNHGKIQLKVFSFKGSLKEDQIYLESFSTTGEKLIELNEHDVIHMRLDPPFDSRYLRILWMLDHLCSLGIKVMNDPRGIMNFNEKLFAYRTSGATPSFVGQSLKLAKDFVLSLKDLPTALVLKPLDLYSGIGVEKLGFNEWEKRFESKVKELNGPVVVQPYIEAVSQGEIRSIYFKGHELGTILKTPQKGEFLSNIAQGATFHAEALTPKTRAQCEAIAKELSHHRVDWIAFDILGDSVQEVNITCPGLLVEVSYAHQRNLADVIIDLMN